ncbi:MAG TPA: hypothetical protein HA257_02355, partial [Candidatus Methanoperedenaceae archaeon]|nr:hypothetical protein [Candidatus Methanoperedenaceae archaeon]
GLAITMEDRLLEKFMGCLLGAAIGDALGMQTEGKTRKEIVDAGEVRDYGRAAAGSPNAKLTPGHYTDDTEQMLLLAESIIEAGRFSPESFSAKLAEHGKLIIGNPALNRSWGPTSMAAVRALLDGAGWMQSGQNEPTCGSAMRVAPIALAYCNDITKVESMARMSSLPTHASSGAIGGAVAAAVAVACALHDMDHEDILAIAADRASHSDRRLEAAIIIAGKHISSSPDLALSCLGTSNSVYETVPAALYCFAHAADPEEAILTAVNAGGDTDSIAAIAGAISGAACGECALPSRWLSGLENRRYIEEVAGKLFSLAT